MNISRRELYAAGEPFGESATHAKPGGRVYGGGGGGDGTSTTVQSIPDELKPLASAYTNKAIDLSNQGFNPYYGQRNADLTWNQNAGLGMIQNRALNGSSTMRNGESAINGFLTQNQTNPYLDSLVNKAQQSVARNFNTMVKPQTESAMVNSGSFGNAGLNETLQNQQKAAAQQMSDVATQMYGGAYDTDQANRMNALQLAPTYGKTAYDDANQLLKAGQIQQDQNQNNLDFGYQQYQDAQNLPYKQLAAMSGVFGSNLGSSSTTQQTGGGK